MIDAGIVPFALADGVQTSAGVETLLAACGADTAFDLSRRRDKLSPDGVIRARLFSDPRCPARCYACRIALEQRGRW
jgi:hypothetical protein